MRSSCPPDHALRFYFNTSSPAVKNLDSAPVIGVSSPLARGVFPYAPSIRSLHRGECLIVRA